MKKELQFLMYATPEEDVRVQAVVKDETLWLTQKAMAELFACSADNISLHLKNIYADGELKVEATTEDFSVVRQEGNSPQDVRKWLAVKDSISLITTDNRTAFVPFPTLCPR